MSRIRDECLVSVGNFVFSADAFDDAEAEILGMNSAEINNRPICAYKIYAYESYAYEFYACKIENTRSCTN